MDSVVNAGLQTAHLVSFEIALVVGTLVIARARGATDTTAAAIYAGAVAALFGTSALYHRGGGRCA